MQTEDGTVRGRNKAPTFGLNIGEPVFVCFFPSYKKGVLGAQMTNAAGWNVSRER